MTLVELNGFTNMDCTIAVCNDHTVTIMMEC